MKEQSNHSANYEELMTLKLQNHGKGVVATVFGIISLIICLSPISLISGIIAIITGSIARKKSKGTVGTGGMIMGIIGSILSLIPIVLFVIFFVLLPVSAVSTVSVAAPQVNNYIEQTNVSIDEDLCATVCTAISVALADPAYNGSLPITENTYYSVEFLFEDDSPFSVEIRDILGIYSYDDLVSGIRSTEEKEMEFCIISENGNITGVEVRIPNTDISYGR